MSTPSAARADRIADSRAEARRVLAQIQADGQRLEVVIERYDGARVRLAETMRRIDDNEVRLASARRNLRAARHALSVSLISAYKHPMPDPLQAALEARNFGQVLEQFALLDRANSNSADELAAIRAYRTEVDKRQRSLNRERNARRETVAELRTLKGQIQASVSAAKQRYRGLRSEVRRLIEERRRAEIAASRRAAERARLLQAASEAQPAATNDIGGVAASTSTDANASSPSAPVIIPAPSSLGTSAVNIAVGQLGTPYVWGGSAPGGFDCSGLVTWAFAQAGRSGLPHYTGALWLSGTRVSSQTDLAPGDLVFFHGLGHMGIYIGNDQFVHAPHTGDVVKISSLSSYGGYVGAVRISG
ncbi:MAG: NlpC/P60 family protein [Actinomycetota bacterium]|nr:NlpC/P60 family protein [Actinomycetota bacterium]